MDNKKYFKKLLKNYLDLRKTNINEIKFSKNSISKTINKIEKSLTYIEKVSDNNSFFINLTSANSIDIESSIIETLDNSCIENILINNSEFLKIVNYIKKFLIEKMHSIIEINLEIKNKPISNDIFTPIEEGNLDVLTISESYNNFRVFNNEGSTPLHVCIKNGDTTILKKFLKNGESIDLNNMNGHTLLEYACFLKDPNLIQFLISHGSNPKKHIFFRENNKDCKMSTNDIDIANLLKICLQVGALIKGDENNQYKGLEYENKKEKYSDNLRRICFNRIDENFCVGLGTLSFNDFYLYFEETILSLKEPSIESYIDIINDEFNYSLNSKLGCPNNHFEILILSIFPFIKYDFNISTKFIIIKELLYAVRIIFEKNNFKLNKNFHNILLNKVWNDYKEILPFDFIGINLSNIFTKMKNILV